MVVHINYEHMLQVGQCLPQLAHFPSVVGIGSDKDLRVPTAQALIDGLRTKGGEKRAEDAGVFENPQSGDVQVGDATCQNRDRISPPDAESLEDIGKAIGLPFEFSIGKVTGRTFTPQPS